MSPDSSEPRSKVARLIEAYDLTPIGDELEAAWLGEDGQRQSLRDLADRFNRALLLAAIRDAGMDVVDGEARNYYRLLTSEDVSAGRRVEAENRLEAAGVDVDGLRADFLTYQAIRHYLTEVREASYEPDAGGEGTARERTVIDRLQGRVESVVRDTVDRLRTAGRLAIGDYRVFVSVDVLCQDCGGQYTAGELLDRGHCDCDSP